MDKNKKRGNIERLDDLPFAKSDKLSVVFSDKTDFQSGMKERFYYHLRKS